MFYLASLGVSIRVIYFVAVDAGRLLIQRVTVGVTQSMAQMPHYYLFKEWRPAFSHLLFLFREKD